MNARNRGNHVARRPGFSPSFLNLKYRYDASDLVRGTAEGRIRNIISVFKDATTVEKVRRTAYFHKYFVNDFGHCAKLCILACRLQA